MAFKSHGPHQDFPVYDISPEAVTKLALIEEVRLIASKMDRLYSAINSKVLLPEEATFRFLILENATKQLEQAKRKIKRDARCTKKKSTRSESPKKASIGSAITQDFKRNFLKTFFRRLKESK